MGRTAPVVRPPRSGHCSEPRKTISTATSPFARHPSSVGGRRPTSPYRARPPPTAASRAAVGTRLSPKHARGGARRQHLIVRRLSSEPDNRALQGADEGERDSSGGRAGWDRRPAMRRVQRLTRPSDWRLA